MNFEDVEELKHGFTLHSGPTKFFSAHQQTTYLILQEKNVTYTRAYTVPQVNNNKNHLKKFTSSLLSKLRFKRG